MSTRYELEECLAPKPQEPKLVNILKKRMLGLGMIGNQGGNLRQQLRLLISSHGMAEVHKELQDIFKTDYIFLTEYFKKDIVLNESIPTTLTKPETKVDKKAVKEKVKEKVEKVEEGEVEEEQQSIIEFMEQREKAKFNAKGVIVKVRKTEGEEEKKADRVSTADVLKDEDIKQAKGPYETTQPPKGLTGNAIKQWQKQQEDKRAAQLNEEGIDGMSLLTEENLRKWLEKEGRAYAQVARDIVGVSEAIVAEAAKKYGIQSAAAKRRAAILAMKMKR
jgi:hypothetical protein